MLQRAGHLALNAALAAALAVSPVAAPAQQPPKQRTRALAVVETTPKGARLIPVLIFDSGRFFDANLYRATPRPMALGYETLYDVLRTGEQVGTFTVTNSTNAGLTWFATGKIKPLATEKEQAPSEVTVGGKRRGPTTEDDSDERPTLRRSGASKPPEQPKAESKPTAQADPTKTQPASTPQPAATAKPAAAPAQPTDDDRSESDPNRPTLKRGAGEQVKATPPTPLTPAATKATPAATTPAKPGAQPAQPAGELYTAISDTQRYNYRTYKFRIDNAERARYLAQMTTLAQNMIRKFAATHPTSGTPAPGPLADVQFSVFDTDLSNEPILVLTAQQPGTPRSGGAANARFTFYVTAVGRIDTNGDLHALLQHVTDPSHMDDTPRLALVDAVDAQGTGRAQLLFRQSFDKGSAFVLYRVGADQLWKLFEGTPTT